MSLRLPDRISSETEHCRVLSCIAVMLYVFLAISMVLYHSPFSAGMLSVSLCFFINILSIVTFVWVILRTFSVSIRLLPIVPFRLGIILLLIAALSSLASDLGQLTRNQVGIISAALYVPAALLFIHSLNKLIAFMKFQYSSVVNLSLTDELTGLPNRRHLNIRLTEIEYQSCIMCFIDIDDFKKINDNYGHDTGDEVLERAGLVLSNFINKNTFIARSGGEEFAVIITEQDNYKDQIENIKHALSMSSVKGSKVTVSIGVAQKRADQTASFALTAADVSLYDAKRHGKNQVSYSTSHITPGS